jgi:hypothetical protein
VPSRVCGSGGANVPTLNALLDPFGISFGTEVYSGQHPLGGITVGHYAGSSIRRFPAGGLLHQAVLTRGVDRGERGWVGGDGGKRRVGIAGFYRVRRGTLWSPAVAAGPGGDTAASREAGTVPPGELGDAAAEDAFADEAPLAEESTPDGTSLGGALPVAEAGGHPGWVAAWSDSSCLDDSVPPRTPIRLSCVAPFTSLLIDVLQPAGDAPGRRPAGAKGESPIEASISSLDSLYSSRGPAWRPRTLARTSPLLVPYVDTDSPYTPKLSPRRRAAFRADSRLWAAFGAECRLPNATCRHPLVLPPVWLPALVEPPAGRGGGSRTGGWAGGNAHGSAAARLAGGHSAGPRAPSATQSLHGPVLLLSVAALLVLGGAVYCAPKSRRRRHRGTPKKREVGEGAILAV